MQRHKHKKEQKQKRPKQSQKTPEKARTVVAKRIAPKSRAAPAAVPPARRPRVVLEGPAALSEAARAGAAAGAAGLAAASRAKAAHGRQMHHDALATWNG